MILPEVLSENFVDEVIGIVLVHLDLFQYDAFLACNVFGSEDWVQYQVAQDINCDRHMFVEDLDVEADGLLAGERINIAANGIHLPGNLLRSPRGGPLEQHVFNEMRDTVALGHLVARSSLHPDADGDRTNVRHLFAQNNQSIGKNFTFDVSSFVERSL